MGYFNNCGTLEELRKQYKELLKQHHPDNGGNVADMQEINAEYDRLFKQLKNKHDNTSDAESSAGFTGQKYDFEADRKLREILSKVIHFTGITIDIVGCYIWIDGNTYTHKTELKEIGFRWSRQRKKWYWHGGEYKGRGNSKLSYADIQNLYGSTQVKTQDIKRLKQA